MGTNFPVRPAYLPWVHCLTGYLAQHLDRNLNFYCTGDVIPLTASITEDTPKVVVKKPDDSLSFPRPAARTGTETSFAQADRGTKNGPPRYRRHCPGRIYTIMKGENKEIAGLLAVNLESYESDLTYLDDVMAERESGSGASRENAYRGWPQGIAGR